MGSDTHTMVEDGGWGSNAKMMIRLLSLSLRVGQVGLEELGHAEGADLVVPEDRLHLGVGLEVLLVLGVLELVGLEVGPDLFTTSGLDSCSPFLAPTRSASSALRARGFVSPDPCNKRLLPGCLCSDRLFRAKLFLSENGK